MRRTDFAPVDGVPTGTVTASVEASSGDVHIAHMRLNRHREGSAVSVRTVSGDVSFDACFVQAPVMSGRGVVFARNSNFHDDVHFSRGGISNEDGLVKLRGYTDVNGALVARWVDLSGPVTVDRLVVDACQTRSREPWGWVSLESGSDVRHWDVRGPASVRLGERCGQWPDLKLPEHVELLARWVPEDAATRERCLRVPCAEAPFSSYRWARLQYVLSLTCRPDDLAQAKAFDKYPDDVRRAREQVGALIWSWLDNASDPVVEAFARLDASDMQRTLDCLHQTAPAPSGCARSVTRQEALAMLREKAVACGLPSADGGLPGTPVVPAVGSIRYVVRNPVARFSDAVKRARASEAWSSDGLRRMAEALFLLRNDSFLDHASHLPAPEVDGWEREWAQGADLLGALLWRWLGADTSAREMASACERLELPMFDAVMSSLCRHALKRPSSQERRTPWQGDDFLCAWRGDTASTGKHLTVLAGIADRRGLPEWKDWLRLYASTQQVLDLKALEPLTASLSPTQELHDDTWDQCQSLLSTLCGGRIVPPRGPVGPAARAYADLVWRGFHAPAALMLRWMEESPQQFLTRCRALDREALERMAALICLASMAEPFGDEGSALFNTIDEFAKLAGDGGIRPDRVAAHLNRCEARSQAGAPWANPVGGVAWDADPESDGFRHSAAARHALKALASVRPSRPQQTPGTPMVAMSPRLSGPRLSA
ncbi:hypothetical protein ABE85_21100 [Mitsuaria sp. 7]|nr:hypothetical protein ABE85_21100 [Mitsuaria sp. 7]